MRLNSRKNNQMRSITITPHYAKYAEGSTLIEFGNTKVLCAATIDENIPKWLKNSGWITAEYGMLPRSTNYRMKRESKVGQSGRSIEIARLIGRSLRASVDMKKLGERQIIVDCDVIQADGGTRTAAITGGFIALNLAINSLLKNNILKESPIIAPIAAISVGICQGEAILDLDYAEDSKAETDMNVVMNNQGNFIEIQGTAEQKPYTMEQLQQMLQLARNGIDKLISQYTTYQ